MVKNLKVGDSIVYIDETRGVHNALVTHVWSNIAGGVPDGCNLVFVAGDESKSDPYGRQIDRRTSIVHRSMQPAGAACWLWADEL